MAPDHYYRDVVPFPHLPEPVLSSATQSPPQGRLLKRTLFHWTASGHYANANSWTKPCSTRRLKVMRGFPIEKGAATIPTVLQDPCCHPWGTSALETKLYNYVHKQTLEMMFCFCFVYHCLPPHLRAGCVCSGLINAAHGPTHLSSGPDCVCGSTSFLKIAFTISA